MYRLHPHSPPWKQRLAEKRALGCGLENGEGAPASRATKALRTLDVGSALVGAGAALLVVAALRRS